MGRFPVRPLALAILVAGSASPAFAQGSSVYTQSACVSARAGAAVAAPCQDASSIYYNPGALALMPSAASAGFTAVYNEGSFTYDNGTVVERDASMPLVPQAYFSYRLGADQRWAAALGVWAPYGLGIEWPEDFEGRFISQETTLRGIYVQPTVSYQLIPGRLAIGAGPQIVFGGLELNQFQDADEVLPAADPQLAPLAPFIQPNTDFASGRLDGSGTGFGGHVGVYYQINEGFSVGARYMHSVEVDLEGDADFTRIEVPETVLVPAGPGGSLIPLQMVIDAAQLFDGPLADQAVAATIEFPAQAVIGVRFAASPQLGIAADYQWTGWSSFDEIVADFEGPTSRDLTLALGYNDTHTLRLGADFSASPALDLRGGFIYNTAASPDETVTPILPEADRQLYTLGLGYDFGAFRADAYYNYVDQADRPGRVRSTVPLPGTTPADLAELNTGTYATTAHLFGLTVSYVFGTSRITR